MKTFTCTCCRDVFPAVSAVSCQRCDADICWGCRSAVDGLCGDCENVKRQKAMAQREEDERES